MLAAAVSTAVLGGLVSAWNWSTTLRILDGGHRIGSALEPDLRRTARLWGWLVVLGGIDQLGLLALFGSQTYSDPVLSHTLDAFKLLALYLSFATALLPMAVLLEGQGLRRAWHLSHTGWPTALRVLGTLLLTAVVTSLIHEPQIMALSSYPYPSYLVPLQAAGVLAIALARVVVAPLLYAAYRLSPLVPDHSARAAQPSAL
jgi:hypothetical protein